MTTQNPKTPNSEPLERPQVAKRKTGSLSLFGDEGWSAVAKRKGEQASGAQGNATAAAAAKPTSKTTKTTKPKRQVKAGTKRRTTPTEVEPELVESEVISPEVVAISPLSAKVAPPFEIKDAQVEDVQPEVVPPQHRPDKQHALDAHIVDAELVSETPVSETPVYDTPVSETQVETPSPVAKAVAAVPALLETPAALPVATTSTMPVKAEPMSEPLVTPQPKRIIVPDPSKTDAELDIKELEVLRQIKEFNAKQLEKDREEEESRHDDYFEHDEDDDDDMSGMHLESHKEHESGNRLDDDDYDLDEDESEDDDESSGTKKSRAVVRSAGNIAAFIRIANQEPLLTVEQERFLAERYLQYGDIEAARKLVTSHLRLVISVAHGYTGYGLPLPDLIQEGNVGLMKAVMHFDPNSGRLAAFAVHWIRSEINDYVVRNWRIVKVATTKAQRKIFFNLRQLKKHIGWCTENERKNVADDLGVSSHEVAEMEMRLAGLDIGFDLSEDESGSDKSSAVAIPPSAYLEDENSDFAKHFENVDYSTWQIKKLKESLRSLDERSQYIIKRRWLDDSKATLQELSSELNVSIERVRQIESNAMSKVKLMLLNEGVGADENAPDKLPQLPNKASAKSFPLAKRAEDKTSKRKTTKTAKKAAKADTASDAKADKDTANGSSKAAAAKTKAKPAAKSKKKLAALPPAKVVPISKDHSLVPLPEPAAPVVETAPVVEPAVETAVAISQPVGRGHLSKRKVVDVADVTDVADDSEAK